MSVEALLVGGALLGVTLAIEAARKVKRGVLHVVAPLTARALIVAGVRVSLGAVGIAIAMVLPGALGDAAAFAGKMMMFLGAYGLAIPLEGQVTGWVADKINGGGE